MQQQKVIFLNKVLLVIVITLIIYLVISVILFFYPKQEYSVVNRDNINGDTSHIFAKIWDVSPFILLSHYEKVSSGRLFTSPVYIAPSHSVSYSSPNVKKEPPLIEKPVVAEPEITFKLIGIIWGEKEANALIKTSQEPQTQLVIIGDKISGYQVVNITEEAVILSKGNERKVVRLEYIE